MEKVYRSSMKGLEGSRVGKTVFHEEKTSLEVDHGIGASKKFGRSSGAERYSRVHARCYGSLG